MTRPRCRSTWAGLLAAAGAEVEIWEPRPNEVSGTRQIPGPLSFEGRPQMAARFAGSGGGRSLLLQRPHRRGAVGAARPLDERPQRRGGARREPLRPRRLRHEGRRCRDDVRGDRAGRGRRTPARRPDREHGHRRGDVGRRRSGRGQPRRQGRRRHRHRADGVRRVGGMPRVAVAHDHGRGPPRARRDGPAALARRRRRERHREDVGRAGGDPRAARGVARAPGQAPSTTCRRATSSRPSSAAASGWSPIRPAAPFRAS